MQSFMLALLTCSVTMSAVALAYIATTPLLKRYSEKSRYYAWFIIVIGLIIPIRPQLDYALVKIDTPYIPITQATLKYDESPVDPIAFVSEPHHPLADFELQWWQIAAGLWVGGMVLCLAYHGIKYNYFVKTTKRWRQKVCDEQLLALFQSLKANMGIHHSISVYQCSCISSPLVIGLFNPVILIPNEDFNYQELHLILKHELVHYKRKDRYYKCLVLFATAMHWFNPVIRLIAKAIDELCEVSCDAEVVRNMHFSARRHYGHTVLSVVNYQSKLKTALSTNFYGGKKGLKERMFTIMDTEKKKAGIPILCCMILLTAGTGLIFVADANNRIRDDIFYYEESDEGISVASNPIEIDESDMNALDYPMRLAVTDIGDTDPPFPSVTTPAISHEPASTANQEETTAQNDIDLPYRKYGIKFDTNTNNGGGEGTVYVQNRLVGAFIDEIGNIYYQNQLIGTFTDERPDGTIFVFTSADAGELKAQMIYDKNGNRLRVEIVEA